MIRLQRYQDVTFEHLAGQILRAEALRAEGRTYRAISRDVNLPLSTLHRRLGARAAPANGDAQTAAAATTRPPASATKAAAVALGTRSHAPAARSRQPASVRYKARAAAAAKAILRLKRPQRPLRASTVSVVEAVSARGNVVAVAPIVIDPLRVKRRDAPTPLQKHGSLRDGGACAGRVLPQDGRPGPRHDTRDDRRQGASTLHKPKDGLHGRHSWYARSVLKERAPVEGAGKAHVRVGPT